MVHKELRPIKQRWRNRKSEENGRTIESERRVKSWQRNTVHSTKHFSLADAKSQNSN